MDGCTQNRTGFPAGAPYGLHPVEIHVLTSSWKEHRLLDSGDGLKLEEFAGVRIIRSEPKAWWHKSLPPREWAAAVATHEESGRDGRWRLSGAAPKEWEARFEKIRLQLRFMDNSKQIGVFPEQSPHWEWLSRSRPPAPGQSKLLNLFGYTGAASLVAANAGWLVTHVDASKPAIAWGKRNQQLSNLADLPIRWILEACRDKKGRPMNRRLADELLAAYRREGVAITKRENVHRMADANKAFAHFAW